MLCQMCHTKDATQFFLGNWNGNLFVVGICSECAQTISGMADQFGRGDMVRRMTGLYPDREIPRSDGRELFPEPADPEFLRKLRLHELRTQLTEAAEREDYQEAARLRDEIERMEQEENCRES